MNCLNPMKIKNPYTNELMETPCRHCVNCTIRKISELKVYAQAEQIHYNLLNRGSSFIRLSYNDVHLPVIYNGKLYRLGELIENQKVPKDFQPTLLKSDMQKFWKRLDMYFKRKYPSLDYSYLYNGEYGDIGGRPHNHLILFGIDTELSKKVIGDNWHFGFVDYKPLKAGAVSYISKYMFNDVFGEERKIKYTDKLIEPPFLRHSNHFGEKFLKETFEKLMQQNKDDKLAIQFCQTYAAFPSYFRKKYNLRLDSFDGRTRQEKAFEAKKQAENYVIQQRQRGVPVDARSLKYINI